MLARLSHYFWSLDYPSPRLRDLRRSAELATAVLQVLPALTFDPEIQSPVVENNPDEFDGLYVVKRSKQKDIKRAKRAPRKVAINTEPFVQLGVFVPHSQEAAAALEKELLDDLQDCLRV